MCGLAAAGAVAAGAAAAGAAAAAAGAAGGRGCRGGGQSPPRPRGGAGTIVERRVYSQNGEDGVLESIFKVLGAGGRYYVEFGVESGWERNTRLLEAQGWRGLLMDSGHENEKINLRRERVTAANIRQLFANYGVPAEPDLLSIDIDGNDYYVWEALCGTSSVAASSGLRYRPRVVAIEYNAALAPPVDRRVAYDPEFSWTTGSVYFGSSICALTRLGRTLGYTLVYADAKGVNLFFVRTDVLLPALGAFGAAVGDPLALYRPPAYGPRGRGWDQPLPAGAEWVEGEPAAEVFNTVVVRGPPACSLARRFAAACRRAGATVVTAADAAAPCRIMVSTPGAPPGPPGFAAFAFELAPAGGGHRLAWLPFGGAPGAPPLDALPFNPDAGAATLLEFPTSMGDPERAAACAGYLAASREHTVGELAYSGRPGETNYDREYVLRTAANDITIQRSLARHSLFDKEVTAAISPFGRRPWREGRAVAYDVGGNVGCVGIPLARATDLLVAFEPLEQNFVIYEANIRANRAFNTLVVFAAVGDAPRASVTLSRHVDMPPTRAPGHPTPRDVSRLAISADAPFEFGGVRLGEGGQPVQMTTVDAATRALPPDAYVAAMKVDVEGAEALVFAGARATLRAHAPCVVYESNERGVDAEMRRGVGVADLDPADPLAIARECGYRRVFELRLEDYMVLPEGLAPAYVDPRVVYDRVPRLQALAPAAVADMATFKMRSLYEDRGAARSGRSRRRLRARPGRGLSEGATPDPPLRRPALHLPVL